MMKKVVVYSRVSTEDQRVSGISLEEQVDRLRKYCQRNDFEIIAEYQDDVSAKSFNRPSFQRFIQDLKTKKIRPDAFVCVRLDRFSRNLMESLEMLRKFRELNIEFRTVEKDYTIRTPEDYFYYVLDSTLAQVENDRRGLNTIIAMRHGLRQGRWLWRAPIGYKNNKEDKTIIIDQQASEFVKRGFLLMSQGLFSADEIRRQLNKEGFQCCKQQFLNILKNPFYVGRIPVHAWKEEPYEEVKGNHQPLISDETFNLVQEYLSGKRRLKVSGMRSEEFPLRGFMDCPECGRKLTASASRSRNKSLHFYYHCQRKYNCTFRVSRIHAHQHFQHLLEEIGFKAHFIRIAISKQTKTGRMQTTEVRIAELRKLIQKQDDLLIALNKKFIGDEIDRSTYDVMKSKLESEKNEYETELKELHGFSSRYKSMLLFLFRYATHLKDFFNESDLIVKQRLLGSNFVQNLQIDSEKVRTAFWSPAMGFIEQVYSELQIGIKAKGQRFADLFDLAPPPGLEPGTP
jgi:site-specific DNA recombinase